MQRPALLFDFGGTLDADGTPWSDQFHLAFTSEGIRIEPDLFAEAFKQSDDVLGRWRGIHRAGYRTTIVKQAEILLGLLECRETVSCRRIADHVVAAAETTATRNHSLLMALRDTYRLGVVSNFTGNLSRCLEDLGLARLFESVIDSAILGRRKPDPKIFRWALATLDADARASWMIGDNFEADIRPAAGLGMATCWLAPQERPWPKEGVGLCRLSTLSDLGGALAMACRG
jgi:putative hydrolase of the HAD superfamily